MFTSVSAEGFPSPIVEKLLLLGPSASERMIPMKLDLTIEDAPFLRTSLDAFLSVLPLPLLSDITQEFINNDKDEVVVRELITVTAKRIPSGRTSDPAFKPALPKFLLALEMVIQRQKPALSSVALKAVQQVSRVQGKSYITSFEAILPSVVNYGVKSNEVLIKPAALDCLLSMLYICLGVLLTQALFWDLESCLICQKLSPRCSRNFRL
jgi:hypothetical protein